MAGHSKWANIKHKKAATDAKRGKIFTRLIKEITVAARLGGGDARLNPRLRLADRQGDATRTCRRTRSSTRSSAAPAASRASNYEEIRYEGYGINGAAVIVDCMTDNRTRTVADVRHAFSKYGGNLGTDGSVAFLFKHCGQIVFAPGTSEDKVMEAAIDAGAEDVSRTTTAASRSSPGRTTFVAVKDALAKAGLKPEYAEVTMKPTTEVEMQRRGRAAKMQKLLDALEAIDDVQEVYTSAVIGE